MTDTKNSNFTVFSLLLLFHAKFTISKNVISKLFPEDYRSIRANTSEPITLLWKTTPFLIPSISIKDMEFSVDLQIRAHWFDKTLQTDYDDSGILPNSEASKLWHPWIQFLNCKGCPETIINYNRQNFEVFKNGIYVVARNLVKFSCVFDLHNYPFDEQTCEMKLKLSKWNGPVVLNQTEEINLYHSVYKHELTTPVDYTLTDINIRTHKNDHNEMLFSYIFYVKRISISHILLIFVPSILIVVLSWISFWLDVSAAAPRVALGLTSLLTLATQFNSAQKDLRAMASIKAIDVWMFTCIFMVFGSLIEFAISYKNNRSNMINLSNVDKIEKRSNVNLIKVKNFCCKTICCQEKTKRKNIDDISKVLFPLSFFVFNLTYWSYYL